jgi:predicted secreted protein
MRFLAIAAVAALLVAAGATTAGKSTEWAKKGASWDDRVPTQKA